MTRQALLAENERLKARLEVIPGWSEGADGISCRDATIKLQDGRIARLLAENERLREALERTERFLTGLVDAKDFDELAADGCVTVGMVFQQEATWLRTTIACVVFRAKANQETNDERPFAAHRIAAEQRARIAPASDLALVEEVARAICEYDFGESCTDCPKPCHFYEYAGAILPIIERARIEGARAGLEAAAKVATCYDNKPSPLELRIAHQILDLDPAAVLAVTAEPD